MEFLKDLDNKTTTTTITTTSNM